MEHVHASTNTEVPQTENGMQATSSTDMEGFITSLSCGVDTQGLVMHVSQGTLTTLSDVCEIEDAVYFKGIVAELTLKNEEQKLELDQSKELLKSERAAIKSTCDKLQTELRKQMKEQMTEYVDEKLEKYQEVLAEKDNLISQYEGDIEYLTEQLNGISYNPPQPWIPQQNTYRNRNSNRW